MVTFILNLPSLFMPSLFIIIAITIHSYLGPDHRTPFAKHYSLVLNRTVAASTMPGAKVFIPGKSAFDKATAALKQVKVLMDRTHLSMGCQFKHREICRQLHDLRIVMRKELRAKRMGPLHPPAGGAPPAGAAGGDSSSDSVESAHGDPDGDADGDAGADDDELADVNMGFSVDENSNAPGAAVFSCVVPSQVAVTMPADTEHAERGGSTDYDKLPASPVTMVVENGWVLDADLVEVAPENVVIEAMVGNAKRTETDIELYRDSMSEDVAAIAGDSMAPEHASQATTLEMGPLPPVLLRNPTATGGMNDMAIPATVDKKDKNEWDGLPILEIASTAGGA